MWGRMGDEDLEGGGREEDGEGMMGEEDVEGVCWEGGGEEDGEGWWERKMCRGCAGRGYWECRMCWDERLWDSG